MHSSWACCHSRPSEVNVIVQFTDCTDLSHDKSSSNFFHLPSSLSSTTRISLDALIHTPTTTSMRSDAAALPPCTFADLMEGQKAHIPLSGVTVVQLVCSLDGSYENRSLGIFFNQDYLPCNVMSATNVYLVLIRLYVLRLHTSKCSFPSLAQAFQIS